MDVRKDLFKNIILQNQKVSGRIDFRERRNILRGRSKILFLENLKVSGRIDLRERRIIVRGRSEILFFQKYFFFRLESSLDAVVRE